MAGSAFRLKRERCSSVKKFWIHSTFTLLLAFSAFSQHCDHLYTSGLTIGQTGNFSSPGYPHVYPNNLLCRYTFQGTRDERIKIVFADFHLENGTNAGCLFDYVDIFTIDMDEMKNLEDRLCGREIPDPIIAVHQRVELVFKSDYAGAGHRGFFGRYEFIGETWQPFDASSSDCGKEFITGVGGEIESPGFPEPYPSNSQCTWMIRVDSDMKIIINFLHLDLEQSANCMTTFVSMYNGFASPEMVPHDRVCGKLTDSRDQLKEFKSKTFRIVLRFQSGPTNEHQSTGFRIVWTAVRPPRDVNDLDGNVIGTDDADWDFEVVSAEEPCAEFHCKGGEYCIDTSGLLCNRLPRYCIAKSLRCNWVPNCGAYDHSDEDGCLTQTVVILIGVTCPAAVVVAVAAVYVTCTRRSRRRRRTAKLKSKSSELGHCMGVDDTGQPQQPVRLQNLEGSPSCKRYSIVSLPQGSLLLHHHHHSHHHHLQQPYCPAVRRASSYSGSRTSFRQNIRYVAPGSRQKRTQTSFWTTDEPMVSSICPPELYNYALRTSASYHMALDNLNFENRSVVGPFP